jgi:transcription elongation factor Elf1
MATGSDYTFTCPECGESMSVNAAMREALVEKGCVVCGASVSRAVFSSTAADGQSV